jgi:hypothetical protein
MKRFTDLGLGEDVERPAQSIEDQLEEWSEECEPERRVGSKFRV